MCVHVFLLMLRRDWCSTLGKLFSINENGKANKPLELNLNALSVRRFRISAIMEMKEANNEYRIMKWLKFGEE